MSNPSLDDIRAARVVEWLGPELVRVEWPDGSRELLHKPRWSAMLDAAHPDIRRKRAALKSKPRPLGIIRRPR